ncbi:MAG: hypothetical protein U9Q19_08170 [Pseudomonadota bacterium]|nr:hypothetical protein [Pseudomonadota bacterium]
MKFTLSALSGLLLVIYTAVNAGEKGTVLWYAEQEAGIEPYKVRYIVSRDFMRSDEGSDEGGFVLLDRAEQQIYSVVPQNRTILHIDGRGELPQVPSQLSIEIKRSADEKAPKLAGEVPVTLELVANQELCYSAIIVPGHLEQARAALREFAQALSIQQSRTLAATPQEYQTPCFLSRYLYATDFHLQQGIPLLDWSQQGHRRELLDYQTGVELDDGLFELPDGFATIEASGR